MFKEKNNEVTHELFSHVYGIFFEAQPAGLYP